MLSQSGRIAISHTTHYEIQRRVEARVPDAAHAVRSTPTAARLQTTPKRFSLGRRAHNER